MSADTVVRPRRNTLRPVWEEQPSLLGQLGKGTILTLVVAVVVVPLWVVVVTSLSSEKTINSAGGYVFLPREFNPSAYVVIFSGGQITDAILVSTIVTLAGTALSLVVTVLAAYGLSRPGTLGHRPILFYFLLTFLIYPGMIPSYLVVTGLGLKDNLLSLILPTAISAFNLVVLRAFFMSIPGELYDSARMDGAGELRVLTRIVLPLSKAVTAVVGLFYAVGYWNAFFNAILYIDRNDLQPVQRVLQQFILAGQSPASSGAAVAIPGLGSTVPPSLAIKMAVVVVTIVPALIIYPFVQRHFTKGVIIGAVKG
ncbi:ABC transporter permease [Actinoplanes philippinensis]|uniref:Putative aldouronate transport system permease protein n=1 Tax=Actinoplanes philippinensis TaxID=35752 RepID=A0A1I2K9B9_9ACTN|nr:carbohydrate ABC transporter permease [Actinoplanes philippinensis]GIE81466.1 ABC transporter permease [Actinoplanes philippinensis]SFF61731.1 putative aldouronate transport system permease protein [Actinoplanes philippinensis]